MVRIINDPLQGPPGPIGPPGLPGDRGLAGKPGLDVSDKMSQGISMHTTHATDGVFCRGIQVHREQRENLEEMEKW